MHTDRYIKCNFVLFLTILFFIFSLWSCQESNKKQSTINTISIPTISKSNNQLTGIIKQDAGTINTDAGSIKQIIKTQANKDKNSIYTITPVQAETIDNKASNIQEHAGRIIENSNSIDDNTKQLSILQKNFEKQIADIEISYQKQIKDLISNYEKICSNLKTENDKLKAEENKKTNFIWNMLKIASGIGIAAGIVLFFLGQSKMGIPITFASVTLMAITVFLQRFELYIAIAAGILLVVLIGYIIHNAWQTRKTGVTTKTALEEVVHLIDEHIKPSLPIDVVEKLFGPRTPPPPPTPVAATVQSPTTQKLVKQIRGKVETPKK